MTARRVVTAASVATRLVEGWTTDEATQAWFFLAGRDPDTIAVVNDRIMNNRQINESHAIIDHLLGVDHEVH